MIRVSAFILALAEGISSDLRDHVSEEKLQHEVETELQRQILAQLVTAIQEYNQALLFYHSDKSKLAAARNKASRMMDHAREMWTMQVQIRAALGAGAAQEPVTVIQPTTDDEL